jgi:hypothetical protein
LPDEVGVPERTPLEVNASPGGKVPDEVGVPESTPLEINASPGGKVPLTTVNE